MGARYFLEKAVHSGKLMMILAILAAVASGSGTARAGASVADEERLLAQEGFAFALAGTVLVSQTYITAATFDKTQGCMAIYGGGGSKLISEAKQGAVTKSVVHLYYDTKCAEPFIEATSVFTEASDTIAAKETATYFGLQRDQLGTLMLDETVTDSPAFGVAGTGTFVPAAKNEVPVSLGIVCKIPTRKDTCDGGIAQNFPALNLALGSVTTITLKIGNTGTFSFVGPGSLVTGGLGKLSVVLASPTRIGIKGATGAESTSALKGSVAEFALFPPTPTSWTLIDKKYGAEFSIHVVSDTLHNLAGTITQISSGTPLATFTVDRSGTGKIDYSDGSEAAITAWTLAD
jgi:hypothetical protein